MTRRLTLRREALTALGTSDLASVHGANGSGPYPTPPQYVTLVELCIVSHGTCTRPTDPVICA